MTNYIKSYEIGATYGSKVNVESFSSMPNMGPGGGSGFFAYGESIITGSRARATRGAPFVIWNWGYVYVDMFNAFRALCTGGSASMVIRTIKADNTNYEYYDCVMVWPELDSYEFDGKLYQPFALRFENAVVHV